jgi:hypothetical protein
MVAHAEMYGMKLVGKRVDELGEAIQVAYKRLDVATGYEYEAIKAQIAYLEEQYKAAYWRKV